MRRKCAGQLGSLLGLGDVGPVCQKLGSSEGRESAGGFSAKSRASGGGVRPGAGLLFPHCEQSTCFVAGGIFFRAWL